MEYNIFFPKMLSENLSAIHWKQMHFPALTVTFITIGFVQIILNISEISVYTLAKSSLVIIFGGN